MLDILEPLLYFLVFCIVAGGLLGLVSLFSTLKKRKLPSSEKSTAGANTLSLNLPSALPTFSFSYSEELILFLLVLISFFIPMIWGTQYFAIVDFSVVVHGAQRIYHGQIPQCDFIVPTGPLVLYMQAFFYCLFGETLYAFLFHVSCLNVVGTLLVFFLVRQKGSLEFAISTALTASIWFYGIHPFPWFDTTAYILVVLTWLLWEKTLFPYQVTPQIKPAILVGICSAFAFLGKMNIGGVAFLLLCGLVIQRFWPKPWKPLFGLLLGAGSIIGAYVLFLWSMNSSMILDNLVFRPLQMDRFSNFLFREQWAPFFMEFPEVLFLGLFLLIISMGLEKRHTVPWKHTLDLLALFTIALFGKMTSRALRTIPFGLLGVIFGLWGSRFFKHRRKLDQSILCYVLFLFSGYGIYLAIQPRFYYDPKSVYAFTSPALKPYHIDENTGTMIDEVVQTLQPLLAPDDSVLCLPNGGLINLALGHVSPFLFLWYDPGMTYFEELGDENRLLYSVYSNPPTWIVLTLTGQFVLLEDFRMMAMGIRDLKPHLDIHYQEVIKTSKYVILKHKS
ncbi:MAG: hypothetical protein AABZ60_18480 [Planctomycetota bacterium]